MSITCNKPRILVVGSLVMDLIVTTRRTPQCGETVAGESFATAPGGKGANQALQARRLGAQVAMVGRVGDDAFGRELKESLSREGIDVTHVLVTRGCASAVGNIVLSRQPDGTLNNRIIVAPGANMALTPDDVAFLENSISAYDMVMLQLEIPMEVNQTVMRYAKQAGVPVMLNPAPYAAMPGDLLAGADYISPNETEAANLLGFCPEVSAAGIAPGDVAKIAEAASAQGIHKLILTLGSHGAMCVSAEGARYCPAVPGVTVADPTAAGDSFVGAFCTAHCLGYSDQDALTIACHTAAITVGSMGAQPSLPGLDAVIRSLAEKGDALNPQPLLGLAGGSAPDNNANVNDIANADLDTYIKIAGEEAAAMLRSLDRASLFEAAALMLKAHASGNRVHVSGIGKPAHIAAYGASLLSSTGIPAYYLHGTEAVHGSCGQLTPGDIVIFLSNSGETAEMKACIQAVINNGCPVVGISGKGDSWLAKNSGVHILAHVNHEGGPLNRAPRASILAETMVLQALSVITQSIIGWDAKEYVKRHPGGALGKL